MSVSVLFLAVLKPKSVWLKPRAPGGEMTATPITTFLVNNPVKKSEVSGSSLQTVLESLHLYPQIIMLFPESHDHPAFKAWLTNTIEPLYVSLHRRSAVLAEAEIWIPSLTSVAMRTLLL